MFCCFKVVTDIIKQIIGIAYQTMPMKIVLPVQNNFVSKDIIFREYF
jgi:hypothetical protein